MAEGTHGGEWGDISLLYPDLTSHHEQGSVLQKESPRTSQRQKSRKKNYRELRESQNRENFSNYIIVEQEVYIKDIYLDRVQILKGF